MKTVRVKCIDGPLYVCGRMTWTGEFRVLSKAEARGALKQHPRKLVLMEEKVVANTETELVSADAKPKPKTRSRKRKVSDGDSSSGLDSKARSGRASKKRRSKRKPVSTGD